MICLPCKTRHHEDCKGGNWCDCQHEPVIAGQLPQPGAAAV